MGAFFRRGAKDEERSIVLLGEELEGRGVLKGVDGVLFCEFLSQGLAKLEQVVEAILDDLGAGGPAEEEDGLGVLDGLGGAFCEGPLGAGVAWFAVLGAVLLDVISIYRTDRDGLTFVAAFFGFYSGV